MLYHRFVFVCLLLASLSGLAQAQSGLETPTVSLTIDKGFPLQIVLTDKLQFKQNETVHGEIFEDVYAFDRRVIPAGTRVVGRVTGFKGPGKLKRFFTVLTGDFSSKRQPQIRFEKLIFADGTVVPIDTAVVPKTEELAVSKTDAMANALKKNLKGDVSRIEEFLWGFSPYRPQGLPAGARYTARLKKSLEFGEVTLTPESLEQLGSTPPEGATVAARLTTTLDSRKAKVGTPIEAVLTRPLISKDSQLVFPQGSTLRGEVVEVQKARKFHRHARLGLEFTSIEAPASVGSDDPSRQEIESRLVSVEVANGTHAVIDGEDRAAISESKKQRFIAPAYAVAKAVTKFGKDSDSLDHALVGAYRSKVVKQMTGSGPGFGLAGSVAGAMVPPVGIGLGVFGAARSIYSNFLGRGQDIVIPKDTVIELELTPVQP